MRIGIIGIIKSRKIIGGAFKLAANEIMGPKGDEKPVAEKTDRLQRKNVVVAEEKKTTLSPYSIAGIKKFIGEVQAEYHKIAWPDKKVVMGSTGVVIVLVMLISLYLGAVDLFVGKIVTSILN